MRMKPYFIFALFLATVVFGGDFKGFNDDKKENQFDALKEKKPVDTPPIEDPDFVRARELFWSGSYNQAEALFRVYLSKNPDHETTKKFLRMIREAKSFDPEREKVIRKALDEVRFKRVEWKEITLDQALAFIREETKKQLPEGEHVNFINLVPPSAKISKITLHVEDVTLNDLVKSVASATGVFHYVASDGIVFETKAQTL